MSDRRTGGHVNRNGGAHRGRATHIRSLRARTEERTGARCGRRARARGLERARGARRPSPALRRLDLPEGQARARRVGRAVRAPRGARGDRPALRARPRAAVHVVRRRPRAAEGRSLLARPRRLRRARPERGGRRGPLAPAGAGGRAAHVRARPDAAPRARRRLAWAAGCRAT